MPNPQIENGHLDLNGGWVRLYRKTLESAVFQNPVMLKIWIWCLLKANHEGRSVFVRTGRGETLVNLQPGQFIFGRNSASKELSLPASTIHDVMMRFRKTGNLTIFPDSHFSIVSISKWNDYQAENPTGNPTGNRQATDTNKNVKNVKNVKKESNFSKSLVSLFSEVESGFTPEDLQHKQNFLDYWTEANPNGKKERWQMERVFDVKRRFLTWLRNHKRWSGQDAIERKARETDERLKNWGAENA